MSNYCESCSDLSLEAEDLRGQVETMARALSDIAKGIFEGFEFKDRAEMLSKFMSLAQARARDALSGYPGRENLYIVFDGPCGQEGPRFVEAEDGDGKSVSVLEYGIWTRTKAGMHALCIMDALEKRDR